jgi:hypothetical protein
MSGPRGATEQDHEIPRRRVTAGGNEDEQDVRGECGHMAPGGGRARSARCSSVKINEKKRERFDVSCRSL